MSGSGMQINGFPVVSSEQITVSNTALPFTSAKIRPTDGSPKPTLATVVVNTAAVRWWPDGTTPTTTNGTKTSAGGTFEVSGGDIDRFKVIRDGGTDAEIAVIYSSFLSDRS